MSTTSAPFEPTNALANKVEELNIGTKPAVRQPYSNTREVPPISHGMPHPAESHTKESLDKLERDFKTKTDEAAAEGHADVQAATDSYIGKALHLADYGLATAQTYVGAGKERLTGPPHAHDAPPTGLAASLAASAASALGAVSSGLGYAQQTLHQKSPELLHGHERNPHHAVTSSTKPMGQALSDNVTAAQTAAQPHVDTAKATVQPHVDAAAAVVQPHVDAARPYVDSATATVQSSVDSVKGQYNAMATNDKPVAQQVQEAASAGLDSAKESAGMDKSRPVVPQAQEAIKEAYGMDKNKPLMDQMPGSGKTYSPTQPEAAAPQLAGGPGVLPPAVSQTSDRLDPALAPSPATKTSPQY